MWLVFSLGSGTGFSASFSSWLATSKHFLATSSKNILLDVGDEEVNLAASVTWCWATDVWAGLGIGIGLVGFASEFCCAVGILGGCEIWSGLTMVDVGVVLDGFDAIVNKCWWICRVQT